MRVPRVVVATARAVGRFLDTPGAAWAFGVGLPPVMLFLDPIVFRGDTFGRAVLGAYRPGGYVGIALGMSAMAFCLTLHRGKAFLAGVMAAASLFSLAVGVIVFPLAIFGILLLGLGLLGLSPLLCAVLFFWWARRCFRESASRGKLLPAAAGVLAFSAVCGAVQLSGAEALRSSADAIMSGRLRKARAATDRLRRWSILVDMDQFVPIWERQTDPERRQRLAEAYRELTGEDLEHRLHSD